MLACPRRRDWGLLVLRGEEGRGVVGSAVGEVARELVDRLGGNGGLEGGEVGRTGSIRVVLLCHCWQNRVSAIVDNDDHKVVSTTGLILDRLSVCMYMEYTARRGTDGRRAATSARSGWERGNGAITSAARSSEIVN